MNTTSKALSLSLVFHSLMALFAALMLNMFHNTPEKFALPLKKISLVSLSNPSPTIVPPSFSVPHPPAEMPKQKNVSTPQEPPQKSIVRDIPPIREKVATISTEKPSVPAPSPLPSVESKPSSLPVTAAAPKAQPKIDISAEKQSFFAGLRTKIQQSLRYPSAARRRGMEGDVNIRFTLDSGGSIRDVIVSEGESIFHEAAKNAVASASGVKIPEALSGLFPTEVKLTLEFRLN